MDVRMGSRREFSASSLVEGIEGQLREALKDKKTDWVDRIVRHPDRFEVVEREVHALFQKVADQMVAGLLARASQTTEFEAHPKN